MRKLILTLGLAATAATAEKAGSGLFQTNLEKVGSWELARYSRDAPGKQVVYYTANVITGQEQAFRVGFTGEASAAEGPAPTVSFWFDNRTSEKTTKTAR